MRILMITSALNKEYGGPPVAVTEVACALSEKGTEVTVAIFGQTLKNYRENPFGNRLKNSLVKIEFFESKRTSKYGGSPRLRDLHKFWQTLEKSDVITVHQIYNVQNVYLFIAMFILRKKYVVMPHGTLTSYQIRKHRWRKKLVNFFFTGLFLNKAKAIFVATTTEKNEINLKFLEKTKVVGLGISKNLHFHSKEALTNRNFTFVYMGRLTEKKRIDIAINSLRLASEISGREITFIICGKGDLSIEKEIESLAILPGLLHLDYRGWVDGPEKNRILSNADAFILTSEDENFAIAVAEGLSYGLPCLISKKVALSTLVSNFNSGRVFTELDVANIANDAVLLMGSNLNELSANALKASEQLHWSKISEVWISEISHI